MLTKISSFGQVSLVHRALLVLDIDETILKYKHGDSYVNKNWWTSRREHLYGKYGDQSIANKRAFHHWIKHIHNTLPEHTDEDGLKNLLKRATELEMNTIFLTARSPFLAKITKQHLAHLNIPDIQIFFCRQDWKR